MLMLGNCVLSTPFSASDEVGVALHSMMVMVLFFIVGLVVVEKVVVSYHVLPLRLGTLFRRVHVIVLLMQQISLGVQ